MRVGSAIGAVARHTLGVAAQAFLIVAIVAALVIAAATAIGTGPAGADSVFAARGGNGGGGSTIWVDTSTLRSADGTLQFGESLNFGYRSDTAQSIQLQCFQSAGTLVFADSRMLFEGGLGYGEPFTLGPSLAWTGGEATCTGALGHRSHSGRYVVEAQVDFAVAP